MKSLGILLAAITMGFGIANAQQSQPSVKRHPGEHLHYRVSIADGDVGKITGVSVALQSRTSPPANQPNAQTSLGGQCKQSADPKEWDCDVVIPTGIADGDYRLYRVNVGTPSFGTSIDEEFHLPVVPVENPNTFKVPTKITVTPQP